MAFKLPTGSVRRDVHDRHGASTKLGVFCQRYNSKHANRQHEPGSLNLAARIPALAIDVEHAHFKRNGQRSKAAAEVCVTREDNSCLIQSFICPGLSVVLCCNAVNRRLLLLLLLLLTRCC